ncbi:MAG: hypothetical protein HYZ20_09105 [Burkholderiales bacterium]|nr:hypothetical protein [Burkholderiales bacterium]
MAFVAAVQAGIFSAAGVAYDARPIGERLGVLQRAGVPLARVGSVDHGSFDFAGRLREPLASIELHELGAWFEAHPAGVALWEIRPRDDDPERPARLRQPWRGKVMVMLDATQWPAWAPLSAGVPRREAARPQLR